MQRIYGNGDRSIPVLCMQGCRWLRQRPLYSYPIAVAFTLGSVALQFTPGLGYEAAPFLTVYPAIVIASLLTNAAFGFFVAILYGPMQWVFFIPQIHILTVATFVFDSAICIMLIDFINRSFDTMLELVAHEKRSGEQHFMIAHEMRHRIQNLFAVIQGVIRLSLVGEGLISQKRCRDILLDRLQAMAEANRAITDCGILGVPLSHLIRVETETFRRRVNFGGNGLTALVDSQMAQNLCLILHELMTNAVKYGALSAPEGEIWIRAEWSNGSLQLHWQECGGPPPNMQGNESGFGSRLLDKFARRFAKKVELAYLPSGLKYMLMIHSDQVRMANEKDTALAIANA